jgi:hypothetical protein
VISTLSDKPNRVRRFHLKNSFSKQNETKLGPFCFLKQTERTWQDSEVMLLQGLSIDDLSQVLLVLLHTVLVHPDVGEGSWILYSRYNYGINTYNLMSEVQLPQTYFCFVFSLSSHQIFCSVFFLVIFPFKAKQKMHIFLSFSKKGSMSHPIFLYTSKYFFSHHFALLFRFKMKQLLFCSKEKMLNFAWHIWFHFQTGFFTLFCVTILVQNEKFIFLASKG